MALFNERRVMLDLVFSILPTLTSVNIAQDILTPIILLLNHLWPTINPEPQRLIKIFSSRNVIFGRLKDGFEMSLPDGFSQKIEEHLIIFFSTLS